MLRQLPAVHLLDGTNIFLNHTSKGEGSSKARAVAPPVIFEKETPAVIGERQRAPRVFQITWKPYEAFHREPCDPLPAMACNT